MQLTPYEHMEKTGGFTLLEALLSVSLIALLTGIAAPLALRVQTKADLDTAASGVVALLRRAQTLARAGHHDTPWGVSITQGTATLFSGTTYAARQSDRDEELPFSPTILPSGRTEIAFSKIEGRALQTGVLTLINPTNDTRTITITAIGALLY